MSFFFADVLVGIFYLDFGVGLLLSILDLLVVDSQLVLGGLLVLDLGLTPETTTNLSIVSLVSKEAQISLSKDVVM